MATAFETVRGGAWWRRLASIFQHAPYAAGKVIEMEGRYEVWMSIKGL